MSATERYIRQTRHWLEQVVLAQQLCPFARQPYEAEQIRFVCTSATDETALLAYLEEELHYLMATPATEVATSLLIHPWVLQDFYDYNNFLDSAEDVLRQAGFEGEVQLASFHPDYCFAGTAPEDAENYTNRSPWPMLHLLREAQVEAALAHYPDSEQIPVSNIQTMKTVGAAALAELLQRIKS